MENSNSKGPVPRSAPAEVALPYTLAHLDSELDYVHYIFFSLLPFTNGKII